MVKGVSIKFKSYQDSVSKILKLIKLDEEIKKHEKIVLKPYLQNSESGYTSPEFTEAVLQFCLANKTPTAEIFIAEGSDGEDTMDIFESTGYRKLAEQYSIGLVDLNNAEVQEISDADFLKFQNIMYPKLLLDSFVISLPKLNLHEETDITGSLSNMVGAYPAQYYKGLFSRGKSKLRKHPMKYAVHDILKCKLPQLAVVDASDKGLILAGRPYEIDQQAAKVLGIDWRSVGYLKLLSDSFINAPVKQLVASSDPVVG